MRKEENTDRLCVKWEVAAESRIQTLSRVVEAVCCDEHFMSGDVCCFLCFFRLRIRVSCNPFLEVIWRILSVLSVPAFLCEMKESTTVGTFLRVSF